ncbi:unnamed protein product [Bathycoccus prasinos]
MSLLLVIPWQRMISISMINFQKNWHKLLASSIERIESITKVFFDINMQRSDHICTRIGEMLGLEMARSYVAGDRGFGTVIIQNRQELPSFVNYEEADFPISLTHGDLKPSNIMILADNSLKLIDLELSGFNYRGFDLMKLYRADRAVFSQEESFFKFLYEYHAEFNLLNNKTKKNIRAEVEQLALECRIFEPLTWLEVINANMKETTITSVIAQRRQLYFLSF